MSKQEKKNNIVGQTKTADNGMQIEVIKRISDGNVKVMFEDGFIVKTSIEVFKSGHVEHPLYPAVSDTDEKAISFDACNDVFDIVNLVRENANSPLILDDHTATILIKGYADAIFTIRHGLIQIGNRDLISAEEFETANRHFDDMRVNAINHVTESEAYADDMAFLIFFIASAVDTLEFNGIRVAH